MANCLADYGQLSCIAFVDQCKAFDSLDYALLLQGLYHLGVCGRELSLTTSYLSDRVRISSM